MTDREKDIRGSRRRAGDSEQDCAVQDTTHSATISPEKDGARPMKDAPTRDGQVGAEERDKHPQPAEVETVHDASTRADQKDLLPDTDAALDFLEKFRSNGPWVLTTIAPDGGQISTATFDGSSRDAMRKWIETRQGKKNLYFSVNDTSDGLTSKAKKSDIAAARALHVDVDPRVGEPIDAERERILSDLRAYNPKPTVIVDSGGGFQAFWLFDGPVLLPGVPDDDTRHLPIETRSRYIEAEVQADTCHNIDRVMRLPGTINIPGKKKIKKGRTPALAHVVEADWSRTYSLEDFPAVERTPVSNASRPLTPSKPAELNSLPVSDLIKALIVNGADPDEPARYPSRSEAVFAVLCAFAGAGVSEADALSVILEPGYAISAHIREQKDPEKYARRQIERACEHVNDSFERDKNKRPLSTSQRNIRIALRRLGVIVRHNQFSGQDCLEGLNGYGPWLNDPAIDRLWLMVDAQFKFRPTRDFFLTVIRDAARQNSFHPVDEYLAGLRWDSVPRIGRWLTTYGGAEDTAFVRAVGELTLIAAVRRVRQPGVKFDEMLVIEGPQGTSKSSALKVLAVQEEWFTDDLPLNAKAQQVIETLSGKWIVEAGELNGMRRGGTDQLKGFLSRTHDKARMAYDRLASEVPRQCIIVGTTNDSRYLRDTTGGRRFWPVAVERFDLEALRSDRDQLWAEAAKLEAEEASIRLDPVLYDEAAAEQNARRVEDPFYDRLHAVLGEQIEGKLKTEDAWRIIEKPSGQRTQDDNARLGDAMKRLGFDRKQRRFGGNPEYCYVRGVHAQRITPRIDQNGEVEGVALTDGDGPVKPF